MAIERIMSPHAADARTVHHAPSHAPGLRRSEIPNPDTKADGHEDHSGLSRSDAPMFR
jgi:hypothetical protein